MYQPQISSPHIYIFLAVLHNINTSVDFLNMGLKSLTLAGYINNPRLKSGVIKIHMNIGL